MTLGDLFVTIALFWFVGLMTYIIIQESPIGDRYRKWRYKRWYTEFRNSPDNPFNSEEARELMRGIEESRT